MGHLVQTKIQRWGNGLALRVSGVMREVPGLAPDTPVEVEVFEDGFTVRRVEPSAKSFHFPASEDELLKGMTPHLAHADEVITPSDREWGR